MRRTVSFLIIYLISILAYAQDKPDWVQYYEEVTSIEDAEDASWENVYEVLNELANNKININQATQEDLEQLPFLSDKQIQDLQEYVYRHKRMQSLSEIALIESINWYERRLLYCFLEAGPSVEETPLPVWKRLKYGKNELTAMATIPFYTRKGDKEGYLGDRYRHWFRYYFSVGQEFKAGFVGSKDAGEPFFKGRNSTGWDYYSFYALLRNQGKLKNLALGRYRLRMGLGLVMNNDYGFGKLMTLSSMNRNNNTIRAHSSRSESNYMQGAAATFELAKHLNVTAFVSYRDIDGTLNHDSLSVATIVKSGYHRTRSEMNRKHNTSQFASGANVYYKKNGFHVGASAVYTWLNRDLHNDSSKIYRRWYPEGNIFMNASIDYGYLTGRYSINGETAIDKDGNIATIHTGSLQMNSSLTLMALHRYYSYRYNSLFAQSFSDASGVKNENGIYLGANYQMSRYVTLIAYTDYAFHTWPRYGSELPNQHCWDNLVQANYQRGSWVSVLRYRFRLREYDNEEHTAFENRKEHRGRLQFGQNNDHWQWRLQTDMAYSHQTKGSFGWMASGNIAYKTNIWSLALNGGYFHTDDYDSRVYATERGLLYSFYFPMFEGKGIRYSVNARYKLSQSLMLIAHLATTKYFDRDKISTSYAEIDKSSKTDLDLQLQWRF